MADLIDMDYLTGEVVEPPAPVHDMPYPPGIYFDMPEDEYHRAAALSASGIKNLLISPMDFWARCSWLNPAYQSETSDAMDLGKAYDARIVEGRETFYRHYAPALDPTDYPNALRTMDEIRATLLHTDPTAKKGGNKPDLIARLLALDANVEVWDTLVAEHAENHKGKELIDAHLLARIEIAAAMIENHPDLCKAFTGGFPQVSIFWLDVASGVPMKARLDYLKAGAIIDLKTFSNPQGKPLDKAIAYAMASRKYHVQAAVYHEAVDTVKGLVGQHGEAVVYGAVSKPWLDLLCASDQKFLFVFQQTGIAPVARGKVFPRYSTFDLARITIEEAKRRYADNYRTFGSDPWIDRTGLDTFEDADFPAFIGD